MLNVIKSQTPPAANYILSFLRQTLPTDCSFTDYHILVIIVMKYKYLRLPVQVLNLRVKALLECGIGIHMHEFTTMKREI